MQYRVAYDVLQEGYDLSASRQWLVPFLLAVIVTVFGCWAGLFGEHEPEGSQRRRRGNPCAAFLAGFGVAVVFFVLLCRPLVGQWRARAWGGAGDYEVTEGTVTALGHPRGSGTSFIVAGVRFRYYRPDDAEAEGCGFRGTFTDPGVPADALRVGVPVRITHHGDCILRVEIAEPGAGRNDPERPGPRYPPPRQGPEQPGGPSGTSVGWRGGRTEQRRPFRFWREGGV